MTTKINSTFMSAPYPGKQGYGGHPTGLLYALTEIADRKLQQYESAEEVADEIAVYAPEGVERFEGSNLESKLSNHFENHNPRIVGISTFSSSYENALKVAELAKENSPDTITIFGGAHEDNYVSEYKKEGKINSDLVIAGNASHALDTVYRMIEENNLTAETIIPYIESNKEQIEQTDGAAVVLYNSENGLKEIKTRGNFQSLDKLALMPRYLERDELDCAESFFIFEHPNGTPKKTTQVMIGEGCPMTCKFCSEGIKKVWFDEDAPRAKQPRRNLQHITKELDNIKERGYEAIFFDDSTFFAKPAHELNQLFDTLKQYNFEWACQTTTKSLEKLVKVNPRMLSEAKASGLTYVYFGIEHTDKEILDTFGGNKKKAVDIESIFEGMRQEDIRAGVSLTFGHPNNDDSEHRTLETTGTAKSAIDYIGNLLAEYKSIIPNVAINLITYHPGTPLSQEAEAKGINIDYTGLPNKDEPYIFFEEGMGPHAKGLDAELVQFIRTYAKEVIGDKLLLNED